MTETLKRDFSASKLYEGETPHSLRHGGTANSFKSGKSLKDTMYLTYMKNVNTAQRESRGLRILYPNFRWEDVGIGTVQQPIREDELIKQMLSCRSFQKILMLLCELLFLIFLP